MKIIWEPEDARRTAGMPKNDRGALYDFAAMHKVDQPRHRFARVNGVKKDSLESGDFDDRVARFWGDDGVGGSEIVGVYDHIFWRNR